ncbi:nucleotide exchange factor GrpE [Amphiplicatus metriothermophilus]|nr:nucleotide exchange factor GrpE [Amphiplicatus metriothermophilus]MBB5517978.1 molecular chaperone GrpE [Amphiplicatus metriothermophilus]
MTGDKDYPPNEGQRPGEPVEETASQGASPNGAGEPTEAAAEDPETLRNALAELNDKVLRLAAELENTRRRAEREKADIARYAIAGFARDLLTVADNFERALAAAPSADDAVPAEAFAAFLEGLKMTDRELIATFERHGVRRINPKGEKFDPHLHQAVAQAPGETPAGHVLDVAQPGFVIGDRVLRAAMVVVSTGAGENGADGESAASCGA